MNQKRVKASCLHKLAGRLLSAAMSASLLLAHGASAQALFPTPELAANVLVIATARDDTEALEGVLGEDYRELLPVDQISKEEQDQFFRAWALFHALVPSDMNTRVLMVGDRGWTLPIPIVREEGGWRFDTVAGGEEMRIRRIGRNELSTMQALLAFRDAQLEYAMEDRDGDGVLEYAQRFISSEGARDGLYWEAGPEEPQSPLGPSFADEVPEEGAYYGYDYRILTAQGEQAPGGAMDYLRDGHMVAGFAAIAWPAEYGESGVTSFLLSRDSVLYQADLGPDGPADIEVFDPDARWTPVEPFYTSLD